MKIDKLLIIHFHSFICLKLNSALDVVKCNIQVYPQRYTGLLSGMRVIFREEGLSGLFKGGTPAALGYGCQGLLKFGLYEIFKDSFSTVVGEENASRYKGVIYLAGAASAEFLADIALCPMEMLKVKMQTSLRDTFPTSLIPAWKHMRLQSTETRFPFGSLVPLWSRNIPYTMVNFYTFETVMDMFYNHIFTKPKDSYDKRTQLSISLLSGYISGMICAIVSHPADSIISLRCKVENKEKSIATIIKETGLTRLMTIGLGTRILMLGTLTGLQWWFYDSFKYFMGISSHTTMTKPSNIPHDFLNVNPVLLQ